MKLRNKKTGDVIDERDIGWTISIMTGERIYRYDSLAELNEEWEDYEQEEPSSDAKFWLGVADKLRELYEPKSINADRVNELIDKINPEPLIKDEKIRKAVRAWAEACGTKTVEITHSRPHMLRIMDATDDDEICFNREIGQVFDEIIYNNIDELCGEEEE